MPMNMGGRLKLMKLKVKQGVLPRLLRFANNHSKRAISLHNRIKRK